MREQASDTHGRTQARAHGVIIGTMETGRWKALTDVPGVRVGQCTVAFGDGALVLAILRAHGRGDGPAVSPVSPQ